MKLYKPVVQCNYQIFQFSWSQYTILDSKSLLCSNIQKYLLNIVDILCFHPDFPQQAYQEPVGFVAGRILISAPATKLWSTTQRPQPVKMLQVKMSMWLQEAGLKMVPWWGGLHDCGWSAGLVWWRLWCGSDWLAQSGCENRRKMRGGCESSLE